MKIRFTRRVEFRDHRGTLLKAYEVGDQEVYTAKSSHYWITPMGGIYFDEAEEV